MTVTDSRPKLSDVLRRLGACDEAIAWVKANANGATTARQRWEECPRGDWMIWMLRQVSIPDSDRLFRQVAIDIAAVRLEEERKRGREPDARSWKAIEVARAFVVGRADAAALRAAREDAWAALRAAYAAAAAAADAADAAAYAAAAYAAAAAAAADAADAYAAAAYAARRRSADIVRRHFPSDAVERALYTLWTST